MPTSAISKILLDGTRSEIGKVIASKPYEAMTLATSLLDKYPDSEEALVLAARTALEAEARHGKHVISSELYERISKAREERFFSPEIVSLGIASKILMGGVLDDRDIVEAKRAFAMGPGITREIMDTAKKLMTAEEKTRIEKVAG